MVEDAGNQWNWGSLNKQALLHYVKTAPVNIRMNVKYVERSNKAKIHIMHTHGDTHLDRTKRGILTIEEPLQCICVCLLGGLGYFSRFINWL